MGVDLVRVDLVGGYLIKIQLLKVWKTLTTAVSVQSLRKTQVINRKRGCYVLLTIHFSEKKERNPVKDAKDTLSNVERCFSK